MVPDSQVETDAQFGNREAVKESESYEYQIDSTEVSRDPSQGVEFTGVIKDADRFGNILEGLLWAVGEGPDGTVAYATRRDDCYNRDGTRPNWCVKTMGNLTVDDVDGYDDWVGASDSEIIRWTFDAIIDKISRSGDEITLKIWHEDIGGACDVTFELTTA